MKIQHATIEVHRGNRIFTATVEMVGGDFTVTDVLCDDDNDEVIGEIAEIIEEIENGPYTNLHWRIVNGGEEV